MNELGIYVPSYKRSGRIMTYNVFEHCTYVVRESEKESYLNAGIKAEDIWAVEDELIDNGSKVYYYIIEHAPEDIIMIVDDDICGMKYLLTEVTNIDGDDAQQTIMAEVERIAQIIDDLDIGMAFTGPNAIPYNYDREFAFKGVCGSIKWINRKVFKAKYDKNVLDNYDLDMVMQELLRNRIVLQPKYLYANGVSVGTVAGGDSVGKTSKFQNDSIVNMKAKWGKYFEYDTEKNKPKINVKR